MPEYLEAEWGAAPNVQAWCTTRGAATGSAYGAFNLAAHVGDDPAAVAGNRSRLSSDLACSRVQWLTQVHGTACFHAGAETTVQAPRADAAWTDEPDVALAVLTADCVPVVVASHDGGYVGVAHAGWRGLSRGVLHGLVAQLPIASAELIAWIGPAISAAHYEVGADVWRHFQNDYAVALRPHPCDREKRLLDLAAVARHQLIRLGVAAVFESGLCTFDDERFFSYRRQQAGAGGETGRFASIVVLRR